MEIILKNIQSIKAGVFKFADTGLVQIIGSNSNGKSILIKTMGAITGLRILDNDERRALISDNEVEGYVSIEYKGRVLVVKLHEDRNNCLVVLYRTKEEKIIRTFRDGGIEELLDEFGFCIYCDRALCLQIYETFGLMPFVNMTPKANGEIVEDVTTDHVAKQFLNNFKDITYKEAKARLKLISDRIETLTTTRKGLVLFDDVVYSAIAERMKHVYGILKYLEPIELKLLNIPPKVKLLDVSTPLLNEIKFVKPMPIIELLPTLNEDISNLVAVLNGECPTCGKRLYETCQHMEVVA